VRDMANVGYLGNGPNGSSAWTPELRKYVFATSNRNRCTPQPAWIARETPPGVTTPRGS